MSGHSHWAGIKHKKGIEDAKRGKIFSKLSRVISLASREGGNPEFNAKLKQAIDEAKKYNLPKENIERAIKRGTGELEGEKLEPIMLEILGPAGIGIIVEGITDNKNRSLGEIKQIAQKRNSKLANEGSVKWQFNSAGIINTAAMEANKKEWLEITAIEAGAQDIKWQTENSQNYLEITTKPEELANVKKLLEEKGLIIESAVLGWTAKGVVDVAQGDKEILEKLFEELYENDSVQNIYSNLKN